MMKFFGKLAILTAVMMSASTLSSFADDAGEVVVLRQQVKDLTDKLNSLEGKVSNMQGHISAVPGKEHIGTGAIVPAGETTQAGLIHTMQDIHMSGFIDTQYNQALGHSSDVNLGGTGVGGNSLRSFDANQNTFSVNNFELDFEKAANPEGGVGFRADVMYGEDARILNIASINAEANTSRLFLQQAYIQAVAPLSFLSGNEFLGDTVDIKAGRFVTLAGAEVIEGKDNWNMSRSFAFSIGEPATHTGVRATYKLWQDKITTYWGVNNGWDANVDNNHFKTLEGGFSFSPIDGVTWTTSTYFGPENASQDGHKRFLLSNVLLWQATQKLSFIGALDYGQQNRVAGLQGLAFENAHWHSYAAYSRYQFTDKFAVAARFEVFRDNETFRTAGSKTLWAPTLTAEYKFYDSLLGRVEWRHDKENQTLTAFDTQSHNDTLGVQMIYLFA